MSALTATSSRAEEIKVLERWIAEAGSQSYLAELLTPEAVKWIREQISRDFHPDLYGFYVAQTELVAKLAETIKETNEELRLANEATEHWQNESKRLLDTLHEERRECDEILAENSREKNEISNLTRRLSDAELIILRLKCKIYDLEHPNEDNFILHPVK